MWREGLLEMLRVALNLRLAKPSSASQRSGRSPLLHIIAERFCEELSLLLHGGLAKAYRREEANGPAFRGKLVFASHIRANAARADRFYVQHTTYDHDMELNRILGKALEALLTSSLSESLAARARACRALFPQVRPIEVTRKTFERIRLTRSTTRYRDALLLGQMILELRAPQLRIGQSPVFALLFDMNMLWERYIASLFRQAAGGRFHVSTQESASLWRAPSLGARTVRPDIVVRREPRGQVLLIADTKWKMVPDGIPSDDDLKQMFVYNELLGAERAVLLYPTAGEATARKAAFHGRAHSLETLHLGVGGQGRWSTAGVRAQVEALVEELGLSAW